MTRLRRKIVAWMSLGVLLFLQLAVAAYACVAPATASGDLPSSTAAHAHMPCGSMDQQPSKLCEQHCVQASQSVDTQPHSVVAQPTLPLIGVVPRVRSHTPQAHDPHRAWLSTRLDPPPLLRFGVLRI
jgi:hypothetical protein